jgi:hypothetical protein
MNPYFYSLGMLVTGRYQDWPYLTAMDLLAEAIADEEKEPSTMIAFLLRNSTSTRKA